MLATDRHRHGVTRTRILGKSELVNEELRRAVSSKAKLKIIAKRGRK